MPVPYGLFTHHVQNSSGNTKFEAFNSVKTLGDSDVSPSYS